MKAEKSPEALLSYQLPGGQGRALRGSVIAGIRRRDSQPTVQRSCDPAYVTITSHVPGIFITGSPPFLCASYITSVRRRVQQKKLLARGRLR